jgi:hypothetical protein
MSNMLSLPIGALSRLRNKTVTATSVGAGATPCSLRPALGSAYLVAGAYGYHAAGGARTCNWSHSDPVGTINMYADTSIAAAVQWALYTNAAGLLLFHNPFIITYRTYPTFTLVAGGAGEVVTVKALVYEFFFHEVI